ncbi:kinesin-like protein KIFC1 isoform X1 [Stegostoma tigrinum]|uniref:kinesin-like protein KIFC1 isoform X1 n=1 Tax=Stegostoma tigrinum TaxID=3053191 RepID=UPI0028706D29|nr:kinesin-like protein KIFC1 isoform X1 [Stegostoma tigrinum]XP_059495554.1 kinesin-like protein KIFC1 isoform X1 [Stegostoma tigrinum]
MDANVNGSKIMAASGVTLPESQQVLVRKRKVADENTERSPLKDRKMNINETVVNGNKNLSQRSRLPQPSLKRMKLNTTVDNTDLAVKKFGSSNVTFSAASTISKIASTRPSIGVRSQYGAGLAKTVQGVGTRSRPMNCAATVTGTIGKKPRVAVTAPTSVETAGAGSKRRPAWDLKGQLSDMKVQLGNMRTRMSEYTSKLEVSEVHSKQLQDSVYQRDKQLEIASSQIEELQSNLKAMELLLKNREVELEKCRAENSAMQGVLEVRGTELEHLTAQVTELKTSRSELQSNYLTLSMLAENTENKLKLTETELALKVACIEEQKSTIASLRDVIVDREERLHLTEQERRRLHNTVQELKGNIRVICRVRPVLDSEKEGCGEIEHVQFSHDDDKVITLTKKEESHIGRDRKGEVKYDFSFDHVFQPMAKQKDVFEDISQLLQSALDGYNVCIFAYGQTGSGKTFTMEGPDDMTPENMGMIPRAVDQIFATAEKLKTMGWTYKFTASFLEIYNETLRDLLVTKPEKNVEYEIKRLNNKSEQLHVTNLKYVTVTAEDQVHNLIAIAKANRSVAKTAANDRSSRSHSVFQLMIEGNNSNRDLQCTSTLSLVDLAGSERLDKSHSKGDRLREAQAINTSLSCLGHVIMSLSNKESHIPYRNSKLTYLLQNSLGGNSKTLMFVNVSPLEENFSESLNSLRFASKVNECVIGTAQLNRK